MVQGKQYLALNTDIPTLSQELFLPAGIISFHCIFLHFRLLISSKDLHSVEQFLITAPIAPLLTVYLVGQVVVSP